MMPAAVEELKRIRAEWAALKTDNLLEVRETSVRTKYNSLVHKKTANRKKSVASKRVVSEVLRGVVALVAVASESRALPLRAALSALGATVAPLWSPLVTHVVWAEGGDREARAEARSSAASVVSPLWVEACAASNRRLPEETFPAAPRPSDLPSPNTLLNLLKKADHENIQLNDLISDNAGKPKMDSQKCEKSPDKEQSPKVGESDDLNQGKSGQGIWRKTSDPSRIKSSDPSRLKKLETTASKPVARVQPCTSTSKDSSFADDIEDEGDPNNNVNMAPRRALPASIGEPSIAPKPNKAVRKLFTQNEVPPDYSSSDSETEATKVFVSQFSLYGQLTQRERDGLARAERLARKIIIPREHSRSPSPGPSKNYSGSESDGEFDTRPKIGEPRRQRTQEHGSSTQILKYTLPSGSRNKLTNAYDLPGSSRNNAIVSREVIVTLTDVSRPENLLALPERNMSLPRIRHPMPRTDYWPTKDGRPRIVMTGMTFPERRRVYNMLRSLNAKVQKRVNYKTTHVVVGTDKVSPDAGFPEDMNFVNAPDDEPENQQDPRTLNALLGAVRGCRVVSKRWVQDCYAAQNWLGHMPYIIPGLAKTIEKAFVERSSYGLLTEEYALSVFYKKRVRFGEEVIHRHEAETLLDLCAAIVYDSNGELLHNGHLLYDFPSGADGQIIPDYDVILGTGRGEVDSSWVFESVIASRARDIRPYVNSGSP